MNEPAEHIVPQPLHRVPLERAVRTLFQTSWGDARSWIARGKVTVDGERWTDSRKPVRAGARLVLAMTAPKPRADDLPEGAIVYVDAHVVVVNKPTGISTVPYEENERGALDERVRAYLSRHAPRGERGVRPSLGVVHRIDKETTGLVVFTRTWLAKQKLTGQFRQHTVHRRYLAIAHGVVRARTHESWLVADRGDGLRGSVKPGHHRPPDAQRAVTHIDPIEPLTGATLVACRLETGRTHQIRIHLSESGHPLVGERVYIRGFDAPIPAPRLMLHAAELGFVHPANDRAMRWTSDPPADFEQTLARLRRP